MKASGESAKAAGKQGVAYNTASAMIFVEGIKILCCLGVENYQGDAYRRETGESRRTITMQGWIFYAVPSFLYAVDNNLKIPAAVYLDPHVFSLFNNSKVIFAAISMVLLLGKRFSVLQWMSIALLGMSLCVSKVQLLLPAPDCGPGSGTKRSTEKEVGYGLFTFGIFLVLSASFVSGLAGVSSELLLKKRDGDVGLWRKNIWTYQRGVVFNTCGALSSYEFGDAVYDSSSLLSELFRGYDKWAWAFILSRRY